MPALAERHERAGRAVRSIGVAGMLIRFTDVCRPEESQPKGVFRERGDNHNQLILSLLGALKGVNAGRMKGAGSVRPSPCFESVLKIDQKTPLVIKDPWRRTDFGSA